MEDRTARASTEVRSAALLAYLRRGTLVINGCNYGNRQLSGFAGVFNFSILSYQVAEKKQFFCVEASFSFFRKGAAATPPH